MMILWWGRLSRIPKIGLEYDFGLVSREARSGQLAKVKSERGCEDCALQGIWVADVEVM